MTTFLVSGAFRVEMQRENQKDRSIVCKYDPTEPGDYRIEVRWSGEHVPGSPFNVMIFDTQEELGRFVQVDRHFPHCEPNSRNNLFCAGRRLFSATGQQRRQRVLRRKYGLFDRIRADESKRRVLARLSGAAVKFPFSFPIIKRVCRYNNLSLPLTVRVFPSSNDKKRKKKLIDSVSHCCCSIIIHKVCFHLNCKKRDHNRYIVNQSYG